MPAQGRKAVIPVGLPQKKRPMRLQIIGLIVTLAVGILIAPLATEAPPGGKIPRLGVLVLGFPDRGQEPFRQGLAGSWLR